METFDQLDLHPGLVQAVTERGYQAPTPIQAAVIPLMLAGRDVIGQAQTGTGKTAAFALPILQNLSNEPRGVQVLVLAPTRELALQVAEAVSAYGRHLGVRALAVYGGSSYSRQINALRGGVAVVVGTPGRLLDLVRQGVLNLSGVRALVLDEADEMLSMGFIEDIEAILGETPADRQTALFSATLPAPIRKLASRYMHDPQSIAIHPEQPAVEAIEQRYVLVNQADKLAALTRLLEAEPVGRALVFVRTRQGSAELAEALSRRGLPVEALNGDLNQETRERVLNRFRSDHLKILVATDVAARGLDIEDITHVFNFDLPEDAEYYVHRIGRTGRAGKAGIAIALITPGERWRLKQIERFTHQSVTAMPLPSQADLIARREKQLQEKVLVWLQRGRCLRERELVSELVDAGHDPLEIAAAALKIARAEEKQQPILPVSEVQAAHPPKSRGVSASPNGGKRPGARGIAVDKGIHGGNGGSHERGMVRLTLSKGKAHGIRPSDVVSNIAYHADIPGSTIGKIRIHEQHTLVDVPEQYAARVLAKSASLRIRKQPIEIEPA